MATREDTPESEWFPTRAYYQEMPREVLLEALDDFAWTIHMLRAVRCDCVEASE